MNSGEEINDNEFQIVGKQLEQMETITRPALSYWEDAWLRIKKNRIAFFSLILIVLYVLMAVFVPILSPYNYAEQNPSNLSAGISAQNWFGTDSLGRDLFVRVWMGARVSLSIGFLAALLNAVIGTLIGGISGYFGGKADILIMRLVEVLYGIPNLIVTILVMLVIGRGVFSLVIAMTIVGWIGSCRFIRGEILRLKEQDFVLAAKVLGVPSIVIIVKHLIPNVLGLIITNLTSAIPGAIFGEAFLSFIGLGVAPPTASWGILAKEGIKMLRVAPTQLLIPGFFICTTVLALNLLGDGLRDAFDPRLRGEE
jgi:oligopeptide transport system permease protein